MGQDCIHTEGWLMADETYSLAIDFGGEIAASSLFDEITVDPGVSEDPTCIVVDGDVVTISFAVALSAPQKTALDAVVASHDGTKCKKGLSFSDTFSEVLTYGETANNIQDKFLLGADNQAPSNQSAPVAEKNGEVVHISVSSNGDKSWRVDVVVDAFDGLPGTYSGGTVIGSFFKPAGVLDHREDVTGFNFSEGQRIAAYLRKDSGGGAKPNVRLFISYADE